MTGALGSDIEMLGNIAVVPTILEVVTRTTGTGFAAVAKVTAARWVACGVLDNIDFGLKSGGELPVETTICHEIRQKPEIIVINDVANDPRFCSHHTPATYGFQSYISMPIVLPDGTFFGTLCAIDPNPHVLDTPAIIGMFRAFAELIAFHVAAHLRVAESDAALSTQMEIATLREQFIAVLGHDLRNPLASIDAGTRLLLGRDMDEKSTRILGMMQHSTQRMSRLIDDVLDFARGRLGGGFVLSADPQRPLRPELEHVIAELLAKAPDREIAFTCGDLDAVQCDASRIAQLLSNLLGNALTHGATEAPIRVYADAIDRCFVLWVANAGSPIKDEVRENLFQPFFRGEARSTAQGLGLGLFIAAEIARAHQGILEVASNESETRFTFRMPLTPA